MYKLFLSLRYLKSRAIAYFAVLAVALCVAMMLIVISVMNGFLDKIESAAKGLFGDVVMQGDLSGIGFYDEFIAEVIEKVPEVEGGSPFIHTFGILRVPGDNGRIMVEVAGIRLPERVAVTDFEKGLFVQEGLEAPSFDPPFDLVSRRVAEHNAEVNRLHERYQGINTQADPIARAEARRLYTAKLFHSEAMYALQKAAHYRDALTKVQRMLDELEYLPPSIQKDDLWEELSEQRDDLELDSGIHGPAHRVILGLGLPMLSYRTKEGETVRYTVPGSKVEIMLWPLGRRASVADITPVAPSFTVIDDCRTDVSSIDSKMVYLPFRTLQRLNNLSAEYTADVNNPRLIRPARTSQIHFKVASEHAQGEALIAAAEKVQVLWEDFRGRYPKAESGLRGVTIQTWRQMQAGIIAPIEKQRTLVVTMFGIISMVSVVLIFVIFYTIVVQKTKDIGVIKSVGGSNMGVAQIFLVYGASIGLAGSILGCVGGYYFVRHINPIQDWLDEVLGFRVWSREWFLFEKIPNTVDLSTAVIIALGAIAAGLFGALLPAIRAGRMQPVEALRYE